MQGKTVPNRRQLCVTWRAGQSCAVRCPPSYAHSSTLSESKRGPVGLGWGVQSQGGVDDRACMSHREYRVRTFSVGSGGRARMAPRGTARHRSGGHRSRVAHRARHTSSPVRGTMRPRRWRHSGTAHALQRVAGGGQSWMSTGRSWQNTRATRACARTHPYALQRNRLRYNCCGVYVCAQKWG